jgi:hypothetical protein
MSFITFGKDSIVGAASVDSQRSRFVKDLRTMYDLVRKNGIDMRSNGVDWQHIAPIGRGARALMKKIGYAKGLHLLAALNNLAQRNVSYFNLTEKNPAEKAKLIKQLQGAFADVHAANADLKKLSTTLGAVAGKKAYKHRLEREAAELKAHPIPQLYPPDFEFPPGLKKADRPRYYRQWLKSQVQGCVMGGIAPLLLLAAGGAAGVYLATKVLSKDSGSKAATPQALLSFFIRYAAAKKAKQTLDKGDFVAAAAIANSLNLPKTAAAITSDSGLPTTEKWPGTAVSVNAYVKSELLKLGLIDTVTTTTTAAQTTSQSAQDALDAARKAWEAAQVAWGSAKNIPGTVKGTSDMKELHTSSRGWETEIDASPRMGRGSEEDMEGVYTTGVDAIVGAARGRRARRAVSPMMQPVKGLSPRRPNVEIIEMEPLQIRAGKASPAMATINPQLAALLSQIEKGTQSVRSTTPVIKRQRSIWPGQRGPYPY